MQIQLDPWQREILKAEGDLCICSGRQVGKSTVVSIKAAEFAVNNPNKTILICSVTEKQAFEMLQKTLIYLQEHHKQYLKKPVSRNVTKSHIKLTNGAVIRSEPVGQQGIGVLGFTIDLIIADEAAFMPEAVWNVLTPMLFSTGGHIILVSTPNTRQGYFWDAYSKPELGFRTFYVNSEEVEELRADPQKSNMAFRRLKDKARMTPAEYGRWYLAKFQDEFTRLFSDQWIAKTCTIKRAGEIIPNRKYYLGMDIGGLGEDPSTYEIFDGTTDVFHHIDHQETTKTYTDEVVDKTLKLNEEYKFKRIYVDDGGLGFGVISYLKRNPRTKEKSFAINNSARPANPDSDRSIKTRKEEIYFNLQAMGQSGNLKLLDDDEIAESLRSIVIEIDPTTKKRKIHGKNTHNVEGIARGVWPFQEKHLNLWIRWS